MTYLTPEPIDVGTLLEAVRAPDRGGITTFVGVVRDHHAGRQVEGLEYEAHGPMAEDVCRRIVEEAERRWSCRVALAHRTGTLEVGDVAVAIAAGAGHRDEAFEACRYVIEELKRRVPIWKRERYSDGTEAWVDPTAASGTVPARAREAR
jgi:molybdopterin synthase catalytic subunit